jgi:hypothetical protein
MEQLRELGPLEYWVPDEQLLYLYFLAPTGASQHTMDLQEMLL